MRGDGPPGGDGPTGVTESGDAAHLSGSAANPPPLSARKSKSCASTSPPPVQSSPTPHAGTSYRVSSARTSIDSTIAPMSAPGIFSPPKPQNEPIRSYAPGSPERAELKARLKELESERIRMFGL